METTIDLFTVTRERKVDEFTRQPQQVTSRSEVISCFILKGLLFTCHAFTSFDVSLPVFVCFSLIVLNTEYYWVGICTTIVHTHVNDV